MRIGRPSLPPDMPPAARAEWRRIVPELEAMGILAKIDRVVLQRYCLAWASWVECDQKLRETGLLVRGQKGNLVRNPLWIMREDAERTIANLERQLTLTPASRLRARIKHVRPPEEEEAPGIAAIEKYRRRLSANS